jgi:hypothetical protein
MTNAELIARLLQSNPLGAELLCKNYENIEFHVNEDTITDIYIAQASCTYEIHLNDVNFHKYATIIVISADCTEEATWTVHCNEPLEALISICNRLPGIDMILEPRTTPSFDVLRRYAYKVHEYCKQVTGCEDCDFENKTEHCPFRRHDGSGLCPSDWRF